VSERTERIVEPPSASELLDLVANFLSDEIRPLIQDEKLSFRVRVAANVLQIARRELAGTAALEPDPDGYWVTREILTSAGSLENLTADLLAGRRSIAQPDVFGMLQRYVDEKLRIAAPAALASKS
jgi:hypothetical protein